MQTVVNLGDSTPEYVDVYYSGQDIIAEDMPGFFAQCYSPNHPMHIYYKGLLEHPFEVVVWVEGYGGELVEYNHVYFASHSDCEAYVSMLPNLCTCYGPNGERLPLCGITPHQADQRVAWYSWTAFERSRVSQ